MHTDDVDADAAVVAGPAVLAMDDAELARRREGWQPLEKPVPAGFMRRYRKHVLPACEGAILD